MTPGLATVEQQNAATRARSVGARAKSYQSDYMRVLRARGVKVNGDWEQQQVGYAAERYKSPLRAKPTTLAQAARTFDVCLARGTVRYVPCELDAHAERIGFDYRAAALERLPQSVRWQI